MSAPRRPERSSIRRHKSSTTINNTDSDNNNEQQQSFQRRWSFRLPQTIKNADNNKTNSSSNNNNSSNAVSGKLGGSQSSIIGTKQIAPPPPSAKETPEASSSISTNSSLLTSSSSLTHLPPASSSWGGPLKIPDYFRGIRAAQGDCDGDKGDDDIRKTDAGGKLRRYASHTDLSQLSDNAGLSSLPGLALNSALGSFLRTPSSSTSSIPAKVVNKISYTQVSFLGTHGINHNMSL